jgi:Cu(I)/Ag(I) efflux system membrane fusion protein
MKPSRQFKTFSEKYLRYTLFMLLGVLTGYMFFHRSPENSGNHSHPAEIVQGDIWTCAMHPQIRLEKPGKCPLCGMDLIPLSQSVISSTDPDAIKFTGEAARMADVVTSVVKKQIGVKDIRLYGKVQINEKLLQSQVAHVPGRIEKLYISFTGESVKEGQVLAQIYSPEIVTAQQELLESAETRETRPEIYEAAKEKLLQWKLTDDQIESILKSGEVRMNVEVVSNTNGIVLERFVSRGDYVSQGTVLYKIADLTRVWIIFDAYESDLPFLHKGENIAFTLQALPGEEYSGTISFIDPVIDPVTRVAKVRVEIPNQSGRLKPEMFATGTISSTPEEFRNTIIIPRSAVLWTGKRSIVYVKQPGINELAFEKREIELGPMLDEGFVVTSGLSEGEEIVTNGAFSVDAAAQLEGKPSMMNASGGSGSFSHNHGNDQEKSGRMETRHDTFEVSGNCEMCKERIEAAAKSIKGVFTASWDMNTKLISVRFDDGITSLDAIGNAIAEAGHDNGKYHTADEVYNKLPPCCRYRK